MAIDELARRREQIRRNCVVSELCRGADGTDWAIRYLLAMIRLDALEIRARISKRNTLLSVERMSTVKG